jgi:hypothetical protein
LIVGALRARRGDLGTRHDQRRFQRFDVVWQSFKTRIHTVIES